MLISNLTSLKERRLSSGVVIPLRFLIDLSLNVVHLELKVDGSVLNPLQAGVEVFEGSLHVCHLLSLGVVAAEEVQVGCLSVDSLALLHLLVYSNQLTVELPDVLLKVQGLVKDLLTARSGLVNVWIAHD